MIRYCLLLCFFALSVHAHDFVPVCQRSPAIIKLLEQTFKRPCSTIDRSDLAIATSFWFRNLRGEMKAGDLSGFDSLREAYFHDVQDFTIQERSFAHLPKLENVLFLETLNITIEPRAFFDCENLLNISLTTNRGNTIVKEDAFFGLPHLHDLTITSALEIKLFFEQVSSLPNLENLILDSSILHGLKPKLFARLPNLKFLRARFLTADRPFEPDVFWGLDQLTELSVNIGSYVSRETFKHLPSLVDLNISGSEQLNKIDDDSFVDLIHLKEVRLGGAPLKETNKAAFRGPFTVIGLPPDFEVGQDEWGQP